MKPPDELDVIHKGFFTIQAGSNTLLRPASVLTRPDRTYRGFKVRNPTLGKLLKYDEQSFFQSNNNVTKAIYKVGCYNFRIIAWFNNITGERIA